MNCLICMWYGMPLISADNLLVVTVNSFGTVFQLAYIILFIIYAERTKKVFIPFYLQNLSTFYGFYVLIHLHLLSLCRQVSMLASLLVVLGLFAIIVAGSLQIHDRMIRWISVGSLTVVSLISMFASPLFIIVSKSTISF